MTTHTHTYGTLSGVRAQLLDRFDSWVSCRVCGGEIILSDGSVCPACNQTGHESRKIAMVKVGMLEGPDAGLTKITPAAAFKEES